MTENKSEVVNNLESLIRQHVEVINTLTEEKKKNKGMFDDIFANDPTYQEHDRAAKEAAKIRTGTKQQVLKRPQVKELNAKIKELNSDIKENKNSLSDYLVEYKRITESTQLELFPGEFIEITLSGKIRKAPTGFKGK